MGIGVFGIQFQRSAIACLRFFQPVLCKENISQIVMVIRDVFINGNCTTYQVRCFIESFPLIGNYTQEMQSVGLCRLSKQNSAINGFGFIQSTR